MAGHFTSRNAARARIDSLPRAAARALRVALVPALALAATAGAISALATLPRSAGHAPVPRALPAHHLVSSVGSFSSYAGPIPPSTTFGGTSDTSPGLAAGASAASTSPAGNFTQSSSDFSLPSYGPALDFTRSYDSQLAQQEVAHDSPGPLGYGWSTGLGAHLSFGGTVPGDIYTADGNATATNDGGPVGSDVFDYPQGAWSVNGNVYVADSNDNRVVEVPGSNGVQYGISMTKGNAYTIAGDPAGVAGASGNGTPNEQEGLTPPVYSYLDHPTDVAVDSAGNVYIADSGNNRVVELAAQNETQFGNPMQADDLYVIAGTGTAGNLGGGGPATASELNQPMGVSLAPSGSSSGDLYIADSGNDRIMEIAGSNNEDEWNLSMSLGDIYRVAGGGTGGRETGGVAARSAQLGNPTAIELSSTTYGGDMFIADKLNNCVVEVSASGGDVIGTSTAMTAGDMYEAAGQCSPAYGTPSLSPSYSGVAATSVQLNQPEAIDIDNGGQLYITDTYNMRVIEVANTTHSEWGATLEHGDLYLVAGDPNGVQGFRGDGGAATSARLNIPEGVRYMGGNLYLVDTGNQKVRVVDGSDNVINSFAGDGGILGESAGDGGPATTAALYGPQDVAVDPSGNVYIADSANNRIQEIAATTHSQFGQSMLAGDVYTVAGNNSNGQALDGSPATGTPLDDPLSVAVDDYGNLYFGDESYRVFEIYNSGPRPWVSSTRFPTLTTGNLYTIVGQSDVPGTGPAPGGSTSADINYPEGLALDQAGDLIITDQYNNEVDVLVSATAHSEWGQQLAAGEIYPVVNENETQGSSGDGASALSAELSLPSGVAVDGAGNLYIADSGNNRIQEVADTSSEPPLGGSANMNLGDVYTVAGSASGTPGHSGDGGPATAALLDGPQQIAVDPGGDLYIADAVNNRVEEVPASSGSQWPSLFMTSSGAIQLTAGDLYTLAGSSTGAKGYDGDGTLATAALLSSPYGLALDPQGDLYVSDEGNNRLRVLEGQSRNVLPVSPDNADAVSYQSATGAEETFYPASSCTAPYVINGSYCALANVLATLSSSSGDYELTLPSHDTITFAGQSAPAPGAILSEVDAAGETLTYGYDTPAPGGGLCPSTADHCETVTAADGRALVVAFNSSNEITSVSDPMGRSWDYAYDSAGDLVSATDPIGHQTSYGYDTSNPDPLFVHDMRTVTEPNAQPGGPDAGDSTAISYDGLGRVSSVTDPMGFLTSYDYSGYQPQTEDGTLLVTDGDQNVTEDTYSSGILTTETVGYGSSQPSSTILSPDDKSLLLTSETDPDGNTTNYGYDSAGELTSQTNPLGDETSTGYSPTGAVTCSTTALSSSPCSSLSPPTPVTPGQTITPPSAAPPAGVTYSQVDDNGSTLWSTTGVYQPGSSSASYSKTTYELYEGNSVTLNGTNDSCSATPPSPSLPCATVNADGVVTQLAYNAAGDLASSLTPDGNGSEMATTTYGYDGDGERTSTTSPDGNVAGANAADYTTTTTYNADGEITSKTEAGGSGPDVTPRTTSYGYDGDGNQTSVTDARGYATTTAYNADDEATLVTDPDGNATLTCYDGAGDVTETVPPTGVAQGNLTASSCPATYPSGYGDRLATDATTETYDAEGNVTTETTPAPAGLSGYETTTSTYDDAGNLLKTVAPSADPTNDPGGVVTIDNYDPDGRLVASAAGTGSSFSVTSYCYDPAGDETAVVPPDGNGGVTIGSDGVTISGYASCGSASPYDTTSSYQTTSAYDSTAELVSSTSPATAAAPSGSTTTYGYDPAGNELSSTNPDGVTTTNTYSPLNLVTKTTYSGSSAPTVTYGYYANGQRESMSDGTGTTSYVYDPFGELTSETDGSARTVAYGYNADGETSSITYPLPTSASWATSDTVNYGYDHADQLSSVTDFSGNVISITPSPDGLPDTTKLGATGDTVTVTPAANDAPRSIDLTNGSGTTLLGFSYSDAPSGAILSESDTPSSSASYTYDAQSRVTSMNSSAYSYDASGNLTTDNGTTQAFDAASELCWSYSGSSSNGCASPPSGATTFNYDASGNRLSATQGGTTVASGSWNGANELTAYSNSAADLSSATYNGDGLRMSDTVTPSGGSASNAAFVWDTATSTPQLLMDGTNAYVYTGGTAPAEQVSLSGGTVTYYVADSLGSVRGVVSTSGSLVASTSYDAWGTPQSSGGLTAETAFGYAGGYTDATGLLYLVNRYYDPTTGLFLSVDPALRTTNQPYVYAADNPLSASDPTGTYSQAGPCEGNLHWPHVSSSKRRKLKQDWISVDYSVRCHQTAVAAGVITIVKYGFWGAPIYQAIGRVNGIVPAVWPVWRTWYHVAERRCNSTASTPFQAFAVVGVAWRWGGGVLVDTTPIVPRECGTTGAPI